MGAAYLKGPARPEPTCSKHKFLSLQAAGYTGRSRMRSGDANTLALYTYTCRECGWIHLTSSPQPDQKPITGA